MHFLRFSFPTYFLCLFIFSCNNPQVDESNYERIPYDIFFQTDSSDFVTINIEKQLDNRGDTTVYSKYIEELCFLQLETSAQSLVPQIEYCICTDENIYLCSGVGDNTIVIFNREGNFVGSIGPGRGPGELQQLLGAFFSNKTNELIVLSFPLELSFYTPNGNFLRKVELPFYAKSFTQLENGYLFKVYGFPSGEKLAEGVEKLVLTDLELNEISRSVPFRDYNGTGISPFPKTDKVLNSFHSSFSGTVYEYLDGKMIPHYRFDSGKYQIPEGVLLDKDVYERIDYFRENEVCRFCNAYFETDDCIFFDCSVSTEGVNLFVDKVSRNVIGSNTRLMEFPFYYPLGIYNAQFVSIVDAGDVCSFVTDVKKGMKYDEKLISLETFSKLEQVQTDDNPVLIFYRMKSF